MKKMFTSPGRIMGYYIVVQTIFYVMVGIFEIPLIFRLTSSIQKLSLVYIFYYGMILLAFIVIPKIINYSDIGKVFKFSLFLQLIFCLLVILTYKYLNNLYLICSYFMLLGFQDGTYWFGRDTGIIYAVKNK